MPSDLAARPMADDELFIERTFSAPVALVFAMWSQREHMIQWYGPRDSRCVDVQLDFRVGGEWSATVHMPAYGNRSMGGRYLEIEPGRRIVKTFQWRNGEPEPVTVVAMTFEDLGDGRTQQTFHQTPFTDIALRDSHIGGWKSVFDSAEAYLKEQTQ